MALKSPPKPIYCLRDGKLGAITSLSFQSVSDQTLISGCSNSNVTIWSLKTYRIISNWKHGSNGILWIGYNNNRIYTQAKDGYIKFWDEVTLKETGTLKCTDIGFCKADLSKNGNLLYPTEDANKLHLKSLHENSDKLTISHNEETSHGMTMCLKISEDSSATRVIAGYESGNIMIWDIRQNNRPLNIVKLHSDPIMSLDFDGVKGMSGSVDENLCIWDMCNDELNCKKIVITNCGVGCVRIRDDKRIVCTGGWDSRIRIFSWKSLKPLAVLEFHTKTVDCAEFIPKSNSEFLLAVGSKDGRISLWDLYNNIY